MSKDRYFLSCVLLATSLLSSAVLACEYYDLKPVSLEILNPKPAYVSGETITVQVSLTNVGTLDIQPVVPPAKPSYYIAVSSTLSPYFNASNTVSDVTTPGSISAGSTATITTSFTVYNTLGQPDIRYLSVLVGTDQWKGGTGCTQEIIDGMAANNVLALTQGYVVLPQSNVRTTVAPDVVQSGSSGDPVNTLTGEFYRRFRPDLDLGGPLPLRFVRFYSSGLDVTLRPGSTLGNNWRHNFDWRLVNNTTQVEITTWKGRLISFSRANGNWQLTGRQDIPFTLTEDTINGRFTLLDPRSGLSYIFDMSGTLLEIRDGRGSVHQLGYDPEGRLTQVSDGLGRTLTFGYDATGNLAQVSGDGGRSVQFGHGGATGRDLLTVTDVLGQVTTYNYDPADSQGGTFPWPGILVSEVRPLGNTPLTNDWDMVNGALNVKAQTDALGNTTGFAYNGADTTVTDPLGRAMVHTHSATGELAQIQRKDGTAFSLSSNAAGQRDGITDALGATTGYTYHAPSGRIAAITHANSATTSFAYTARTTGDGVTLYDLTGITHADGTTQSFTYDANGNLTGRTDQAGNDWAYSYNGTGQLLTATNPLGGVTSRSYNTDTTLASRTDASGNTTTYAYDAQRRPVTVTHADGASSSVSYDAMDHPLSLTDPRGNSATFTWDSNGNLTGTTDRTGAVTGFSYDAMDRLTATTDANGNSDAIAYDAVGRMVSRTDRNGNRATLAYDSEDRLTGLTDGNGNIWRRSYDAEGIIASSTTPLGNTTTYASDDMGRITRITSPLGNRVRFSFDAMGRVTQTTDPLGNVAGVTYDARGLPVKRTLPENISASYGRDALGNITTVTDPNGNAWQRGFDAAGRLTSSADPLGRTTAYAYDQRNRVETVTFPGSLGTLTNSYDANGNLIRRLYSDGTDLNFSYDAEDRLTGADGLTLSRDILGRITASDGIAIAYDAGGRITSITYATGKAVTYEYDANDNLVRLSDWLGGVSTFTWDADNRLTTMTRPNGVTTSYEYDADGRLTAITHGTLGSIALTRDAGGRITSATRNLPQAASAAGLTDTTHSFDAAAQISTAGFSYDAMGRMTSDGAKSYTWDLASRLTAVDTTTHAYDALGYRTHRTAGGVTRDYVWNHALALPSVAIERDGAGNDLRYYIHTPGGALLYAMDAATGARHFYHFDESGNTRFVTDDGGAVVASYAHSPFGVLLAASGSLDNPFTWQGQWGVFDDGDGLYYIRARYYHASIGRFLSRDPIKSVQPKKINPYQYALNNPLFFGDVSGLDETWWFDSIVETVGGAMNKVTSSAGSVLDGALNVNSALGGIKSFVEIGTATGTPGVMLAKLSGRFLSIMGGADAVTGSAITKNKGAFGEIADWAFNIGPEVLGMWAEGGFTGSTAAEACTAAESVAAAETAGTAASSNAWTWARAAGSRAGAAMEWLGPYVAVAWVTNKARHAIEDSYRDYTNTLKKLYDQEARNGFSAIKLARAKRGKAIRDFMTSWPYVLADLNRGAVGAPSCSEGSQRDAVASKSPRPRRMILGD